MKLQAEVNGELHEVELSRDEGVLLARVDGRAYVLDQSEPEPGVFLLKSDGQIYEASVSGGDTLSDSVQVRNTAFEIKVIDPKRLRSSAAGGEDASGKAEIKTAMPGKVVRILKAVDDTVEKGDGVIVVEAMKMQNEMKSPKDGVVSEIRASEGDTVGAGDVLVVID